MKQLVSIVVPCYRQGRYLPEALESVLAQSHQPIEVIVVNDGSDDETDVVARRYAGRIRYIKQPNGGLPSARNAGIRQAQGQFLFFLDADDLVHPEGVSWLVEAVGEGENRVAYMGWRRFVDDPLNDPFPDYLPAETIEPLPRLLHENLSAVHTFICPRQLVVKAGMFDETLHGLADWEFWTRLAIMGAKFVTVQKVGAYYRKTPGSMITNQSNRTNSRVEILLRAHRQIVSRPSMLELFGSELVDLEHALLRAHMVPGKPDALVPRLADALLELNRLGFRENCAAPVRLLRSIIGYRAECFPLAWFRLFQREQLRYYSSLNT